MISISRRNIRKFLTISVSGDNIIVRESSSKDLKEALYSLVSIIPMGKVVTYKMLAKLLNTHPRVIAKFLASNDKPIIIPCHRVIMSNGSLGGYSFGGPGIKKKLLELEGIRINDHKVPSKYIWDIVNYLTT